MDNLTRDRDDRERRLMKEGRKRYIHELQKQTASLREWIDEAAGNAESLDAGQRIYRAVHTIKGSAPMFDFMRIGLLAEELDRIWDWTQDEGASFGQEAAIGRSAESVRSSRPHLEELTLELEMYGRELELDEQYEQLYRQVPPLHDERLLVIDDDDAMRSFLAQRLNLDGYEVDDAADVATAQRLLRERTYHLVTLDLMMRPTSGYELIEFMKEDPTLKWIPLMIVSARDDVNDKVRSFYLGADDFVAKPFHYEEIHARICSLLKRTRTFEQLAFRDPLTGVYNRRYFDHQIQVELGRIRRYPAPISMVFIDIDRFKSINDTHGHHVGDLVLQGLAHLLQHHLRATDLLARFGGEEFVIAMPNTPGADAKKTVEAILACTHKGPVAQNEGQSYHITFSAGVSEWHPGMTVDEWIRNSDDAMYEAKQRGRNQVVIRTGENGAPSSEEPLALQSCKKVLIADDDRILRSILIAKLKHLPVQFVEAADGEQAYRILLEQPVDLCLLDGVMPELDGYGLLERLHANGLRPAAKILILSGRSRDEDINRGLQLGANAYMHKPFSMVELEVKVKELLNI
ncbi:diguanylate cyclase [Paenibacillus allorhizosphaerae]|uniref:Regulator of RpoS n=1 Tax=Paenibacillus allorhizosphaerae TaxID=2849866 RepID=A0ABN7TUL2_9BACL|nr:diguanylate cyclase [Paenibacillus allorhizosphaerae]CAG7656463.1 Regulator of RpoS [Paenibacillus allorhizosphaerae]